MLPTPGELGDPTNIKALAIQAIKLAACGRALVRHYAPQVGGVRIGSLPILLGRIRSAGPHPVLGGIFSEPVAMADLPEVIDALVHLTDEKIPFVAQACYAPDGRLAVPGELVSRRHADGGPRRGARAGAERARREATQRHTPDPARETGRDPRRPRYSDPGHVRGHVACKWVHADAGRARSCTDGGPRICAARQSSSRRANEHRALRGWDGAAQHGG